jgi:tetratricopeptide (TPR) repeat protein
VYIIKKDYDIARQKLNEAIAKFPGNATVGAEALAMIGSSYEVQGNWTEALNTYNKLKQEYPLTDFGLNIPFYVAAYYEKNGHEQNAQNAFNEAIGYYLKLSTEYPHTVVGLKSLRLLSNCYIAQKNWEEAVNVLEKVITQYPNPEIAVSVIDAINAITVSQLKDYDRAIGIYRHLIDSNPNHPLGKMLKKAIGVLEELKKKSTASNEGKK